MTEFKDGLPMPRRLWAMVVLMAGLALVSWDMAAANVALPDIATDLNVSPGLVVWVMIAYTVTVLVGILPSSAVAERIGFRQMYGLGSTIFMLGALACAFSTSFSMLLIARVVQGIGSAMLMSLFGGLVRNIYPMRQLGLGVSLSSLVVGVLAVLGPAIGAFIIELSSWRWTFVVYTPVCVALLFGLRALPDVPRTSKRFDWLSCGLSMITFGLFVVGLDMLVSNLVWALGFLGVSCVAGWWLFRRAGRQEAPLVPLDLLRIRPIAFAVSASLASFASQMSAMVALPFYLIHMLDYSYGQVGVLLAAWSVGVASMAPIAGWMSDRYRVAILCIIGAGLTGAGLIWTVLMPLDSPHYAMLAPMVLSGIGVGFFQTPNNRAMLAGAPRRRSGAAGGLQATTRVLGQSVGTALAAIAFQLGGDNGPVVSISVSIVCALLAVIINVVRHFNPTPDLQL
jgi:DHA2 family multidrug resistance protein-like MFS transporter